MKADQLLDLDSVPTDIDDQTERWSLSWKPDGRSESFTKEAILEHAPPSSGIYGLFNFDSQLFIGESDNVQETLLRLESEADFQSSHLRPTGFTFEPCPPESRQLRAAELIARFQPVLQTISDLPKSAPAEAPISPPYEAQLSRQSKTESRNEQSISPGEKAAKVGRRYKFAQPRHVALAAAFVAAALVFFYLPGAADRRKPADRVTEKSATRDLTMPSASSPTGIAAKPEDVATKTATGESVERNAAATPAVATQNKSVRVAPAKASAADEERIQRLAAPVNRMPASHSAGSDNSGKKWSVQISAAPAKDVADQLVQRLVAKGYKGYVAQAEVKGQTYYRVRIGPFTAREEAESARESLAGEHEYRGAYLTGD